MTEDAGSLEVAAVIRDLVRDVPDHPQPGVMFKDITPLLADGAALARVVQAFAAPWRSSGIDLVAGIEARGFILAAPVAVALGVGFVPLRKHGKLPHVTVGADYALEYGSARIEMHADALLPGHRVLLIDDVLATGGTAAAACRLIEQLGGQVAAVSVLLELAFLNGRAQLGDHPVHALDVVPA